MERRINMGDFTAFAEDIEFGMECLEHHGILGQKWGKLNGPPYPLGAGDHSAGEKSAAKAAGVKVGSDSGKGSMDNVKKKSSAQNKAKKPKKEMTEEEKREEALRAVRSGDKKKIAKYAEYLTSQELQDADNRVRNLNNIQREEPGVKKASKAEMEKQEAIRSGDKEKVRQYADQMTYQELSEAMNKIDLTQRLNYEPPPKSTMDKISEIANKVDQARQAAEKGIAAYNVAAALYNSTHKGGAQWPIIEKKVNDQKSKEQDVAEKLVKQMSNDMKQNVQQAQQQNQQKSYKDKSDEQLRNAKIDYKNQQKFEKWKAKQDAKAEKKNSQEETEEKTTQDSEQPKKEIQRKYTPERSPEFKKTYFNTKKFEDSKSKEPTEEQKRLVNEARESDEQYLNRMRNNVQTVREVKTQKLSDYSDSSYDDLIPDSVKSYMSSTPINRSSSNTISREEYNRIKAESEARAKAFTEETNARIEKSQSNARETQAKLDRYDKVRSENAAEEARIKARNEQREKAEANERLNQAREKWQRDIAEADRESQRINRELFGRELDLPPADKPYWWDDPTQVPRDYR